MRKTYERKHMNEMEIDVWNVGFEMQESYYGKNEKNQSNDS
jgi:hypothetical protein